MQIYIGATLIHWYSITTYLHKDYKCTYVHNNYVSYYTGNKSRNTEKTSIKKYCVYLHMLANACNSQVCGIFQSKYLYTYVGYI